MTRYQGHHGQGTILEQLARVEQEHRRPTIVAVAGWSAIVLSAGWIVLGAYLILRPAEAFDWFLAQPRMLQAMPQNDPELVDQAVRALPWGGVSLVINGLVGLLLGRGVLRRRRGARTWLTVTSILVLLVNLVAVLFFVALPVVLTYVAGSIVVIVGIRNAEAKRWFAGASHRYR